MQLDHLEQHEGLGVDLVESLLGLEDPLVRGVQCGRRGVVDQHPTLVEPGLEQFGLRIDGTVCQAEGVVDDVQILGLQDALEGHRAIFLPKISSVVTGCDDQLQTGIEVTWRVTSIPV